jgi:hypothetical protein
MKKKTNIRTVIRKIVREEVAMAIQEVITELKQPTQQISQPQSKRKIVEKSNYTNNSVLNDVLNETAQDDSWKQIGDGTFDSSRMNEVMASQYGNMMNNSQPNVVVDGVSGDEPGMDFLKKDYREVLKKSEEKSKQKRGV